MNSFVFDLHELDATKQEIAGGKGANLGELIKVDGVHVPEGFCVSTDAFNRILSDAPPAKGLIDQISLLLPEDRAEIRTLSSELRTLIEGTTIPPDIREEIIRALLQRDEKTAYAIRSSATAEDLPGASFAGQQDTYLNVIGSEAILAHICKCWASLFTERAIIYRLQNGFDHRKIQMSVIVQTMVFSQASGILFTADPVTSNRKVLSIDATFGLGESVVAGVVNVDNYKVCNGKIVDKRISAKTRAVYAVKDGGTAESEVEHPFRDTQTLTDDQILALEHIGRKIERHFNAPQDIEWCLADDAFYIVQSRPITTLYPIPEANDQANHVYVSVGHQQMMTDAMKPLGLSLWKLTAARPMYEAGGRLYVDITHELASPATRAMIIDGLGKSDPLIQDALATIVDRGDFITPKPDEQKDQAAGQENKGAPRGHFQTPMENDPAVVSDLIRHSQTLLDDLKSGIREKSGTDLFDFILDDIQKLRKNFSDPKSIGVIMTAMNAPAWINDKMNEWLGETAAADKLSQSVPNNITSEMGLALLDVADVIRRYPDIVEYLQHVKDDNFLDGVLQFDGGKETRDAIIAFLDKYGMRCVGEIDITRTRWSENPATLIPVILSNVKNFARGASKQKFEQGRQEALKKEKALLEQLKALPDGARKAEETKQMIDRIRNFSGYREYPKYDIVNHYFVYKQALLKEAERLLQTNITHNKEDIYYLTFYELREVVRTNDVDYRIITKRKEQYKLYEKLTPPRVITSDGEIISGEYKRGDLPSNAIAGLAVSSGVVEGRARVILNMEDAGIEDGDILVTAFTDPSWTPLFVSIKALVTEVGGLMTHGAVIAREYGLPAVVGVENATKLIKDKQRIRVHGTEGYVEIL